MTQICFAGQKVCWKLRFLGTGLCWRLVEQTPHWESLSFWKEEHCQDVFRGEGTDYVQETAACRGAGQAAGQESPLPTTTRYGLSITGRRRNVGMTWWRDVQLFAGVHRWKNRVYESNFDWFWEENNGKKTKSHFLLSLWKDGDDDDVHFVAPACIFLACTLLRTWRRDIQFWRRWRRWGFWVKCWWVVHWAVGHHVVPLAFILFCADGVSICFCCLLLRGEGKMKTVADKRLVQLASILLSCRLMFVYTLLLDTCLLIPGHVDQLWQTNEATNARLIAFLNPWCWWGMWCWDFLLCWCSMILHGNQGDSVVLQVFFVSRIRSINSGFVGIGFVYQNNIHHHT